MILAIFTTPHVSMAKHFDSLEEAHRYGEMWRGLADGYGYEVKI